MTHIFSLTSFLMNPTQGMFPPMERSETWDPPNTQTREGSLKKLTQEYPNGRGYGFVPRRVSVKKKQDALNQ